MKKNVFLMLVCFALLTACSLTKKDLGLAKDVPDETKVETRKELSLPPDFDVLPD